MRSAGSTILLLLHEYTNPTAFHRYASSFPDYGGPQDAEARTNSIRDFKRELRARPIAGDVYTQATNIEDERNGLIGFHSGELEVPAGLLHSEPGQ